MNTLQNITRQLSQLDLMHCDENLVSNIISQIPSYALPILTIPKGTYFMRATTLDMNEKVTVGRLSYRPKNKDNINDKFQRATIHGETIFYSVLLNSTQCRDVTDARMLALAESCWFFRKNNVPDGIYRVAISEWRTTEELKFYSIVSLKGENKSRWFQQMKKECMLQMREHYLTIDFNSQVEFQEFMATQFRKPVKDGNEKEYMISAYYTHYLRSILASIIAGVCYESAVNVDEKLNNILCAAIFPEFIDSSALICIPKYFEYEFKYCNGVCPITRESTKSL